MALFLIPEFAPRLFAALGERAAGERAANQVRGAGGISVLYGLTNNIIDQQQFTILVTTEMLSAVVPTLIAQRRFQPNLS